MAAVGAAYVLVVVVEPLAELAVLAAAKTAQLFRTGVWLEPRLFNPA